MIKNEDNIFIICGCILVYFVNQIVKNKVTIPIISIISKNYFNDVICGCLIIAYANVILNCYKKGANRLNNLCSIVIFDSICGVFWEYVIPCFREERVSDFNDVIAYVIGGIVYWICYKVRSGK